MYGKESLHYESGFYKVAAIVFLPEGLYPPRIAIPPMGVSSMKAVGGLKERNDAFHARQSFFTGDVAPVDTCEHCHDTETAAAGCHYVLVVFGIYPVHVDALACESAVGFGPVPKVIEGSALYCVQQGVVAQRAGRSVGFFCTAGSCEEQ